MSFGRPQKTNNNATDRALQDVYRKLNLLREDNDRLKLQVESTKPTSSSTPKIKPVAVKDITAIDVQNLKISMNAGVDDATPAWDKYSCITSNLVNPKNYTVASSRITLEWDDVLGYDSYTKWTRRLYINWEKFDNIWNDSYPAPSRYNFCKPSRADLDKATEYVVFYKVMDEDYWGGFVGYPNYTYAAEFTSKYIYPLEYNEDLGEDQNWQILTTLPVAKPPVIDEDVVVSKTRKLSILTSSLPLGKYVVFWVGINIPGAITSEIISQKQRDYFIFDNPNHPELYPKTADEFIPIATFANLYIKQHGSDTFVSDIVPEGDKGAARDSGIGEGEGYAISAVNNPDPTSTRKKLYELEVDNLRVRNRFAVKELIFQSVTATNGSVLVSTTGKVKFLTKKE